MMTNGGRFGAAGDYLFRARRSQQLVRMPPASSRARPARRRGPTSHPRMLGAEVSFSSTLPSSACQLYREPVAAGAAGKVRNHLALLLRDADPARILPALFALRSFSRHGHRLSRRAARSFTLASSSSARIDGPGSRRRPRFSHSREGMGDERRSYEYASNLRTPVPLELAAVC